MKENKSTIEVLLDHADECSIRSTKLLIEADRIGQVYGSAAFSAIKKLHDQSTYWEEQSQRAIEGIYAIRRLEDDGFYASLGGAGNQTGNRHIRVQSHFD
jgi:hypothetical protein